MLPLLRSPIACQRLPLAAGRFLSSSAPRLNVSSPAAAPIKTKKAVGGFRGAIFGFLLGTTLTGLFGYYYVIDIYRDSNTLLLEDLLQLQRHVSKVEDKLKEIDNK
ncbi:hypothetical protein V1514DRAFT_27952 [Lipomyces japonicus]|uniref:uncharacterized protein n=1 Tax=Lipomyces japonicus TaxID=56871 RepID=UPI0034CD22E4